MRVRGSEREEETRGTQKQYGKLEEGRLPGSLILTGRLRERLLSVHSAAHLLEKQGKPPEEGVMAARIKRVDGRVEKKEALTSGKERPHWGTGGRSGGLGCCELGEGAWIYSVRKRPGIAAQSKRNGESVLELIAPG